MSKSSALAQQPLWGQRMRFYLGISKPTWLSLGKVRGPVFLSDFRLHSDDRKSRYPRSGKLHPWALDSGAFGMLAHRGRWVISVDEYVKHERRWSAEFGDPDWSAAQDYMCEPFARSKTGLTTRQHQLLTVSRFRRLRRLAPHRPWVPVLQGWDRDDYLRHIDDYGRVGIDLLAEPLVGVGSTCRRQGTRLAGEIYTMLFELGLRLHGFGVSLAGVRQYHHCLVSADSLAWSSAARKNSADRAWAANQIEIGELYRNRIEAAIDGDEKEATEQWEEAMSWTRDSRRCA